MQQASFAVIDTETTGLDPQWDRVVSLAVVPVDAGRVRLEAAWQLLIDPGRDIPPQSTDIHGITDADVRGAPDLAAALALTGPALRDRILVGHNLAFDLAFLAQAGYAADQQLDTLQVSRLLWTGRQYRHSLDALAARTDVQPQYRHSALGDAIATAQALVACLPLLAQRGWDHPQAVAEAYRAQRARRARLKRSIRRHSTRPRSARPRVRPSTARRRR